MFTKNIQALDEIYLYAKIISKHINDPAEKTKKDHINGSIQLPIISFIIYFCWFPQGKDYWFPKEKIRKLS